MKRIAPLIIAFVATCLLVVANARTVFSDQPVQISNGEITLSGTLSVPTGSGPFPAVILLSGSGAQDRDEVIPQIPGYAPFKWIAEYLADQGVAVLRYDDRGTGKSTGKFETGTSADFANDAEAAFKFLLERPEIDPKRIGFLGHSEGGMLAAMVAARNPKVAFVISMAGPGVRGYELMIKQNERVLNAMGMTGKQLDDSMKTAKKSLEMILAKDWAGLEKIMYPVALEQLRALPENQKKTSIELEAEARTLTTQSVEATKGWMAFFVGYDIAADWAKVRVPVLALFGTLDVQVDALQNSTALEATLFNAGNTDVTIKVFPSANHLFQPAKNGSPIEYATLPMTFVSGFLETIRIWLQAHVGTIR
jgi:uncharacterized protein